MNTPFNRTAVLISLGLALSLVVGVLFGAKYYFNNYARQPIAMTELPSPEADSAQCQELISALPDKLMGEPRAELADPVPAGAAAWATSSDRAITLRCGVDLPFQYTEYSEPREIDGTRWLQVTDMTPGSTLTTWYTTDRFPNVALTAWTSTEPEGLAEALNLLERQEQAPRPAPLSGLEAAPARDAATCTELMNSIGTDMTPAEGYTLNPGFTKDTTAVWTAPAREPIVLRCGVAQAPGYEPGVQLQQIDDVPWFEDTTLAEGTTAGTWYALGRSTDIAVHTPQDAAQEALVNLSAQIAAHTPEAQPATP